MVEVRRASTLKSLDELNLSRGAREIIGEMNPEEFVYMVRAGHLRLDDGYRQVYGFDELEIALNRAGFIRGDIGMIELAIGRLYEAVTRDMGYLCEMDNFYNNAEYELYEGLDEVSEARVLACLELMLEPEELRAVTLRFGLDNHTERTATEVAKLMGKSQRRVDYLLTRAIRKLRRTELPLVPKLHD